MILSLIFILYSSNLLISLLVIEDNSVLSLIDECEKKIRELTLNFDLIKEFEKLALI